MAEYLCPIHGGQTVCFVSEKILAIFLSGDDCDEVFVLSLKLPFTEVLSEFFVDSDFYEMNSGGEGEISEDQAFDIFLSLKPICKECFFDFINSKSVSIERK